MSKEKFDLLLNTYQRIMEELYPHNPFKYLDALLSDFMFGIPIIRNLEVYVKHQPNAYCYIFTYGSRTDDVAFHTIEIPFVFGNLDTNDVPEGTIGSGEGEKKLSENVMDAWVGFARTSNPNHRGLPKWPTYSLDKRSVMMLGINSKVEDGPMDSLRKVWEGII